MKNYEAEIKKHLGEYARRRLGVFEEGTFKEKKYEHILPSRLRFLNFLESARAELQDYLLANPSITLHKYFHHLNSSQAFALNLFFPYFFAGGSAARSLSRALGINADVMSWKFEYILDEKEGTNIDVMWNVSNAASVFCEVKLTEREFGAAKNDDRHRKKLNEIYRPRLQPFVFGDLLKEKTFFKNYQILRNISLLSKNSGHQLVFFLPRENELLKEPLQEVLAGVASKERGRIKVAYVEDCLANLQQDLSLAPELRTYAAKLAEKYDVS